MGISPTSYLLQNIIDVWSAMLLLQHFTKTCSKCNTLKLFIYFDKRKNSKDGVRSDCKICRLSYHRDYKCKNKEILQERDREYSLNNIDNKRAYNKKYYQDNASRLLKNQNLYYYNNIDEIKKYNRLPHRLLSFINHSNKRRSISKEGNVTTIQLSELKQTAKVCYWCGLSLKNKKVHIDHYIPLSKGGEHTLTNLVVSCQKCNLNKNAKDPIIFANSIGKLF